MKQIRDTLGKLRVWFTGLHWLVKALLLVAAVVLCVRGLILFIYSVPGLGFSGRFVNGDYIPPKTLWEWLQLLIVPLMLASAGIGINTTIRRNEERKAEARERVEKEQAEKRAQVEREIADDRLKEQALQTYLDRMSALILEDKLGSESETAKARVVARARTLTTLQGLDGKRKGVVLSFLHESGLIATGTPTVDLKTANFKGMDVGWTHLEGAHLERCNFENAQLLGVWLEKANLTQATLDKASLSFGQLQGANLTGAFLRETNLWFTKLEGANLENADLKGANFAGANLLGAKISEEQLKSVMVDQFTTLPDGSHPPASASPWAGVLSGALKQTVAAPLTPPTK